MKDGFIKTAAVTPELRVADCAFNADRIIEQVKGCADSGVKLAVFPELSITGYSCGDLFFTDSLLESALENLVRTANATAQTDVLFFVGAPVRSQGRLYNAAFAVCAGEILGAVPKSFIPNYNEFYEKRYFCSGEDVCATLKINGKALPLSRRLLFCHDKIKEFTVGAEICEDLWAARSPSAEHSAAGANIVVNLSASDETVGKAEYRRNLVCVQSAKLLCGYVYANAGKDESTSDTVFAGHDIIAECGTLLAQSELFENGRIISELDVNSVAFEKSKVGQYLDNLPAGYVRIPFGGQVAETSLTRKYSPAPFIPEGNELKTRAELILKIQAAGLEKRLTHSRASKVVLGLSGGLDSTLTLLVSARALNNLKRPLTDIIAVTMPCFGTTDRTYNNAVKLAVNLGVQLKKINIRKTVLSHFKDIGHREDDRNTAYENAQARERTQVLMDIANDLNGIVVGTGDLSELALGWATYNGDHMSMYGVNASVPKTLVRYLVKYVADNSDDKVRKVLNDVLDTPVSPELLPAKDGKISQKTEEIVGPYELHDFFLYYFVRKGFSAEKILRLALYAFGDKYDADTVKRWLDNFVNRFFAQQFKRNCLPDGPKVGSVALSPRGDWRMPSDASASCFKLK